MKRKEANYPDCKKGLKEEDINMANMARNKQILAVAVLSGAVLTAPARP